MRDSTLEALEMAVLVVNPRSQQHHSEGSRIDHPSYRADGKPDRAVRPVRDELASLCDACAVRL